MSRQRIYAPLCVSVFGVRCGPAGVAVDTRWFSMCAPCLANCGGGGCRGLACCVVAGVLCAGRGRAVAVWSATWRLNVGAGAPCFPEAPSGCHTDALPQRSKEEAERPGDGCPCVGAEETCSAPRSLGRREIPTHPAPVGTRANTVFQASNTSARRNIYTSSPAKSFSEGTQKSRRFRRISGIFFEVRPLGLEPRTH